MMRAESKTTGRTGGRGAEHAYRNRPDETAKYIALFDRMEKAVNKGRGHAKDLNTNGNLAWGEGYVLQAYVEMYRATADIHYLDRLVAHFTQVLANRDDVRKVKDEIRKKIMPGWGSSKYSDGQWHVWAVHTGNICLGPAEFVRIVKESRGLEAKYGDKADEFLARIKESVAAHDDDWRNGPDSGEGYYEEPPMGLLPLNMQNALGLVHLELYQITKNGPYRERAERLARYFRNRIKRTGDGAYNWSYQPKLDGSATDSEDISHAAINVLFAQRCYEAGIVFTRLDMRSLANTWTKHVRRGDTEWADTVGGTGKSNTYIPQAVGRWLDLSLYDRQILEDAQRAFANINEEQAEGSVIFGIAKLVRYTRYDEDLKHQRKNRR